MTPACRLYVLEDTGRRCASSIIIPEMLITSQKPGRYRQNRPKMRITSHFLGRHRHLSGIESDVRVLKVIRKNDGKDQNDHHTITAARADSPLAMLSGQKSALKEFKLRTITAPALCRQQPSQSATRTFRAPRNFGGSATFTLLKVQMTSTAARDGLVLAHLGALAGQAAFVHMRFSSK